MRASSLFFAGTALVVTLVQAQATTSAASAAATTESICINRHVPKPLHPPAADRRPLLTIPPRSDLTSCTEAARATQCSLKADCECTQFSSISACFSSYCGGANAVPTLWIEDADFWCATGTYYGGPTVTGTAASKTAGGSATAAATSKAGADTLPVQVGGVIAAMVMGVVAYL